MCIRDSLLRAKLAIHLTDRYMRIPLVKVFNPFKLDVSMSVGMWSDWSVRPVSYTHLIAVRIFDLSYEGKSYFNIATIYNEEKVLGKTNWNDSTILRIIENEIYKGCLLYTSRCV